MPKKTATRKVVIECTTSAVAFDLDKEGVNLGGKKAIDFGTGGHIHITPRKGETARTILQRAKDAAAQLGYSRRSVKLCNDPEMYAADYNPEACLER